MLHPQLQTWFAEYNESHQHPTNRLTHKFAIPVIVFHIVAMLSWVRLPGPELLGLPMSLGVVFAVGTLLFYLRYSVKYALLMAVSVIPMLYLAEVTPGWAVFALAVAGWLVQLAGHVVWEKKSPAFLRNLLQALIGPIYFLALLTGDWSAETGTVSEEAAAA